VINVDKTYFENHITDLNRRFLGGQFTNRERDFLYNFVFNLKPTKIVEFSQYRGYTTCIIGTALKDCGITPQSFETYEMDEDCACITEHNLYFHDLEYVKVVHGDVLETMDLQSLRDCNFLFIDSEHCGEFVQKYVDKFFGLVSSGVYVMVHDIRTKDGEPINEESRIIFDFVKNNNCSEFYHVRDKMKEFDISDDGTNECSENHEPEISTLFVFKR
jgi:predicted O-methyltransferase YrrM